MVNSYWLIGEPNNQRTKELINTELQRFAMQHVELRMKRFYSLGCQDSNLGMAAPKAAALPLGHTPSGHIIPQRARRPGRRSWSLW